MSIGGTHFKKPFGQVVFTKLTSAPGFVGPVRALVVARLASPHQGSLLI